VDEIAQAAAQGAEITTEIIDTEDGRHEIIITAEDDPQDEPEPETMAVNYDVPGSARKALASAIDNLIADDKLRARYAEAAHKHIVENFTKEKAVAVMNSIYSELLPNN
jgi:glycosyltransferase involved in cell wall biosynthesis